MKRSRLYDYVICATLFLTGAALVLYGGIYMKRTIRNAEKTERIHQLAPYVKMADGKPGISWEDKLDFARRAGVSIDEIGGKGEEITFKNIPLSGLTKSLESYLSEYINPEMRVNGHYRYRDEY